MTPFGKFPFRSLKDLASVACKEAFTDAGVGAGDINAAVVGNALGGLITGQECIRGQVVLRPLGIQGVPVTNVENASASGGSALKLAYIMVASGAYDLVLALGMEKLYHRDRQRTLEALAAGMDLEHIESFLGMQINGDTKNNNGAMQINQRSIFMDYYAMGARMHMQLFGTTQEQYAMISEKNHFNASLNPLAQYKTPYKVDEVLESPLVTYPLTRLMCSPISDGAAAAVLCSADFARKLGKQNAVTLAASIEVSGMDRPSDAPDIGQRVAKKAYEAAELGPEDIDLAEVHDATAFGEVYAYESFGFCEKGAGGRFAQEGHSRLGGKLPVNPSGGLLGRGHPLAASGVAQIYEAVMQLQGRAGKRQVQGAKVALTHGAGGAIGVEPAVMNVQILKAG